MEFTPSNRLADFVRRGMLHVLEEGPYSSPHWRKDLSISPSDEQLRSLAKDQIVEALYDLFGSMARALAHVTDEQYLLTYEQQFVSSVARALLSRICTTHTDDDAFLTLLLEELKAYMRTKTSRDICSAEWRASITTSDDLVIQNINPKIRKRN